MANIGNSEAEPLDLCRKFTCSEQKSKAKKVLIICGNKSQEGARLPQAYFLPSKSSNFYQDAEGSMIFFLVSTLSPGTFLNFPNHFLQTKSIQVEKGRLKKIISFYTNSVAKFATLPILKKMVCFWLQT